MVRRVTVQDVHTGLVDQPMRHADLDARHLVAPVAAPVDRRHQEVTGALQLAQGAENLANPVYPDGRATNFFCGDDAAGRELVRQLVEHVGFDAVDAGPLKNARLLEPMMLLWVACSHTLGTRDLAFRLVRR